MPHCDEYLELISAAVDGALSPAEQKKLESHLASCPECRALYEELTALHAALSDLPPVEVPAGLTERIMDAVAAEQVLPFAPAGKKKPPVRRWRWLTSAAVLALVLAGTWGLRPWENAARDAKPEGAPPAALQKAPASGVSLPEASQAVQESASKMADSHNDDTAQSEAAPPMMRMMTTTARDGGEQASTTLTPAGAPEKDVPPEKANAPAETQPLAAQPFTAMANGLPDQALSPYRQAIDLCAALLYPELDLSAATADGLGQTVTVSLPGGGSVLFFCDTVAEDGRYLVVCDPGDWASQFWVDLSAGTADLISEGGPQSPAVTTREQALERLAEYQYPHELHDLSRETVTADPLSVRFFWPQPEGYPEYTELTVTCTGEDEAGFHFVCLWADSPEKAFHYSVRRSDGQVTWLGKDTGEKLTADEALKLLLKRWPQPGCESWEYENIEPGWQSPLWSRDGVDCWLQYEGTHEHQGRTYYGFNQYETAWEGTPGIVSSPQGYSVPAEGGRITLAGN